MSTLFVLFDIDGTLTESFDLDSSTYIDALRKASDSAMCPTIGQAIDM